MKLAIANILLDEGYIEKYDIVEDLSLIHIQMCIRDSAPEGLKDGMKVMNGPEAEVRVGNCLPLSQIPVGTQTVSYTHLSSCISGRDWN